MTRKIFFSFKYDDIWRVNQIRNIGMFEATNKFVDHADFEQIKRQSDVAIKTWINQQLEGASVTCVLIGKNTYKSRWVDYEIRKSLEERKGVFGIYIHNIKDKDGNFTFQGINPLSPYPSIDSHNPINSYLPAFKVIERDIQHWIEMAATKAGR